MNMKGQYFSFDAIIATVIMVIAFTSLIAYWYGVQSTIESQTGSTYDSALRVADSLFSPGIPSNLSAGTSISSIAQLGLADDFTNRLNESKVAALAHLDNASGTSTPGNYAAVANILKVQNYYIAIEPTDGNDSNAYYIGNDSFGGASEVSVANRGATMNGTAYRVRVYVYIR